MHIRQTEEEKAKKRNLQFRTLVICRGLTVSYPLYLARFFLPGGLWLVLLNVRQLIQGHQHLDGNVKIYYELKSTQRSCITLRCFALSESPNFPLSCKAPLISISWDSWISLIRSTHRTTTLYQFDQLPIDPIQIVCWQEKWISGLSK